MWANADKWLCEEMNECEQFKDVELQLDSEPQKGEAEQAEAELSQKPVQANSRLEQVFSQLTGSQEVDRFINFTVQSGHSGGFLTN